ncbi:hypothetical protein P886_0483 [Alteromonadaceae bacterium 2753L.S.0a.02]|nr:hypothetical protein P886_0483 [Alteromonadaceae bacterium 2753L.S.0a.02]
MKLKTLVIASLLMMNSSSLLASESTHKKAVSDDVIAKQRAALAAATKNQGFGPQAPRDIDSLNGKNPVTFTTAPPAKEMNLCNIHFHKNAEHKGGEFTEFAGNGDGHGYNSGYKYIGKLSHKEHKPTSQEVCPSEHGSLSAGDTIEVHYVYSSAQISPGPSLGSCFNDAIVNPQLRVEAQVFVLVNDKKALSFTDLTEYKKLANHYQATQIPSNTGTPIQYAGSTTGPGYNESGSPYQVTWSVRPKVAKVNINTVAKWCEGNVFEEDHAHGVRNLVINPDLLSSSQ